MYNGCPWLIRLAKNDRIFSQHSGVRSANFQLNIQTDKYYFPLAYYSMIFPLASPPPRPPRPPPLWAPFLLFCVDLCRENPFLWQKGDMMFRLVKSVTIAIFLFVCLFVCLLVGWLVGWFVCLFQCGLVWLAFRLNRQLTVKWLSSPDWLWLVILWM